LYAEIGWDVKAIWDQLVIDGAPDAIPEQVYRNAIENARPELQANYDAYFSDNQLSAMIFPATASAAPLALPDNPQETIIDGEAVSIFINDHNSSPGALAGQPGVVFPIGLNSIGLPLAVSLDGKRDEDRKLLAIAKSLSGLITAIPAPSLAN
jgi:indoleacetamide hydrolase